MKHILLLISVITLATASGCIFPGHRGGGDYHDRGEYNRGHEDYRGRQEYRGHADYRDQYPEPGVNVRVYAP